MYLPNLEETARRQTVQLDFKGYNHTDAADDTQFYNMGNLCSARYPALSPRAARKLYSGPTEFTALSGLSAKERLCWVENNVFYYNGSAVATLPVLPSGKRRQFVSMGAYFVIFPDKRYYNTETQEWGTLEASFATTDDVHFALTTRTSDPFLNYAIGSTAPKSPKTGELWLDTSGNTPVMKKYNGSSWETTTEPYKAYTVSGIAPEAPKNGDYWMDTSANPHALKQFASSSGMWTSVPSTYVRISSSGIGSFFQQYEGVTISGCKEDAFNGEFLIYDRGENYLTVSGILDLGFSQETPLTISRKVPDMDFVCELNNRIWGCSSEKHEIYASALGDPKNWNCFLGTSQDSYALTVGSVGDFTGCIAHLGYVLFFKEDLIHRIYGTKPANFQLASIRARGVAKGSEQSLQIVGETLYYKSRDSVCGYDGAMPYDIGAPLGPILYRNASAGALGRRYYLSMQSPDSAWHLFVYDEAYGFWHREDGTHATYFARLGDSLYYLDGESGGIRGIQGAASVSGLTGTDEGAVSWYAESGDLWQDVFDRKYLARMQIRMQLEAGSSAALSVSYDHGANWETVFQTTAAVRKTYAVPILPHRSDSVRIRMAGTGPCLILGATKELEQGSEV